MSYHNRIMNMPCMPESDYDYTGSKALAYKEGFRDARHGAAEIALEAEGAIEGLMEALEALCSDYAEWEADPIHGGCSNIHDLYAKARSALAKAKGES